MRSFATVWDKPITTADTARIWRMVLMARPPPSNVGTDTGPGKHTGPPPCSPARAPSALADHLLALVEELAPARAQADPTGRVLGSREGLGARAAQLDEAHRPRAVPVLDPDVDLRLARG